MEQKWKRHGKYERRWLWYERKWLWKHERKRLVRWGNDCVVEHTWKPRRVLFFLLGSNKSAGHVSRTGYDGVTQHAWKPNLKNFSFLEVISLYDMLSTYLPYFFPDAFHTHITKIMNTNGSMKASGMGSMKGSSYGRMDGSYIAIFNTNLLYTLQH